MRKLILGAGIVFLVSVCTAADGPTTRYLTVPFANLEITDGTMPPESQLRSLLQEQFRRDVYRWGTPTTGGTLRVRLDQPGTADLVFEFHESGPRWSHLYLVVKTDAAGPITGRCEFFVEGKPESKSSFGFRVPSNANTV